MEDMGEGDEKGHTKKAQGESPSIHTHAKRLASKLHSQKVYETEKV